MRFAVKFMCTQYINVVGASLRVHTALKVSGVILQNNVFDKIYIQNRDLSKKGPFNQAKRLDNNPTILTLSIAGIIKSIYFYFILN
jgi:hypothetical protein